jgi:hypothetical protein
MLQKHMDLLICCHFEKDDGVDSIFHQHLFVYEDEDSNVPLSKMQEQDTSSMSRNEDYFPVFLLQTCDIKFRPGNAPVKQLVHSTFKRMTGTSSVSSGSYRILLQTLTPIYFIPLANLEISWVSLLRLYSFGSMVWSEYCS